jgi:hypothetical protein
MKKEANRRRQIKRNKKKYEHKKISDKKKIKKGIWKRKWTCSEQFTHNTLPSIKRGHADENEQQNPAKGLIYSGRNAI